MVDILAIGERAVYLAIESQHDGATHWSRVVDNVLCCSKQHDDCRYRQSCPASLGAGWVPYSGQTRQPATAKGLRGGSEEETAASALATLHYSEAAHQVGQSSSTPPSRAPVPGRWCAWVCAATSHQYRRVSPCENEKCTSCRGGKYLYQYCQCTTPFPFSFPFPAAACQPFSVPSGHARYTAAFIPHASPSSPGHILWPQKKGRKIEMERKEEEKNTPLPPPPA